MKVVSAKTMADLETHAYKQGFRENDFMENAGHGIALAVERFIKENQLSSCVWLLCGKGNNGGDAFVAGCYLLEQGYRVTAIHCHPLEQCSPLCQQNRCRFIGKKGVVLHHVESFGSEGVIVDGIFGTGFKGEVAFPYDRLIDAANQSKLPILAIDIPSGLNGTTGLVGKSVIQATQTLFLGLPKTGFFLNDGWNVIGELQHIDFGLPISVVDQITADFELLTHDFIRHLLPPIKRNRHKYQTGHIVGLAGSLHMPGAALLASLAAFRGGGGLVRLLYHEGMEAELVASPYELIKKPYSYARPEEVISLMQKATAIFVGPGLGSDDRVQMLLQRVIPFLDKPCVMDADALTLFAKQPYELPSEVILTPHRGEMQTLLQAGSPLILSGGLLSICQKYAEEHHVTLILKGAPTFIFHPHQPVYVNPTGDPGMATAGSGDVLTGLLAALLSQNMDCHHAALLGTYLHGLAGELARKERGTSYGMMASDLIAHFATAFKELSC